MFSDSMSHEEMVARRRKLNLKGGLSSREATELAILEAALFNGGLIETTRDYTPPSAKFKLW